MSSYTMAWEKCLEETNETDQENLNFSELARKYNLKNKEGKLPKNVDKSLTLMI